MTAVSNNTYNTTNVKNNDNTSNVTNNDDTQHTLFNTQFKNKKDEDAAMPPQNHLQAIHLSLPLKYT